jgi:rare lipoprotein A
MKFTHVVGFVCLVALLAACGTPRRPAVIADRAPVASVSADTIVDAIPRADPIRKAGNKSPYVINGVQYEVMQDATGYRERGVASWYGQKFHGRPTSNGEIFSVYGVTAAHKTLPIPSYVRVTNRNNDRSLVVRVNDRGPFHADRIIDLSYAAAIKLGFAEQGTAPVDVELIQVAGVKDLRTAAAGSPWKDASSEPERATILQIGAFGTQKAAQRQVDKIRNITDQAVSISQLGSGNNILFRVRIGPVSDSRTLLALRDRLISVGYESPRLLSQ